MCKGRSQKNRSFWEIFPKYEWVGWLIPEQGSNPTPKITPKNRLFLLGFHLEVGGWVQTFGKTFQKKIILFLDLP